MPARDLSMLRCQDCGRMVHMNQGDWICACLALSSFDVMQGAPIPALWYRPEPTPEFNLPLAEA